VTFPARNRIGPPAGPPPSGPWQPTPRAAHQPSPSGLGLAVILLFWFSPIFLAVWLVGQLLILVQKRWHWHRFAVAALIHLAYVLVVIGPEAALRRHFYVPSTSGSTSRSSSASAPRGPSCRSGSSLTTWS
jgi:hypothetical protein